MEKMEYYFIYYGGGSYEDSFDEKRIFTTKEAAEAVYEKIKKLEAPEYISLSKGYVDKEEIKFDYFGRSGRIKSEHRNWRTGKWEEDDWYDD